MMKPTELQNIFSITYGNKLDLYKMIPALKTDTHSVAFIARTKQNNGIVAYVEKIANVQPYPKGAITVALGGSVLSTFIQHDDFYTAQNVAVLQPLFPMTEQIKLFYCIAIKENVFRYSTCGREANKTLKTLLVPKLDAVPSWVNKTKMPDYAYVNTSHKNENILLNTSRWKTFRYDELFDIERGTGPRKQDLEVGTIPFITSTDTNNGISAFTSHIPTHNANTIGVNRNGSVAEAFYQETAFCSTEDVHIFNPKFEMNKYIAMFLITLIKKEKYRYSYGRKWGMDRMNASVVKLPVASDGKPDFKFMENFIKSLPYSASI